jgi:hypothetical protein
VPRSLANPSLSVREADLYQIARPISIERANSGSLQSNTNSPSPTSAAPRTHRHPHCSPPKHAS